MQSVIFKGPFQVSLEERPIPKIQNPTDAIVRVKYTALCGSELHVYRGHQPSPKTNFIMGHEFIGDITETGSSLQNFKIGDRVVAPFTVSCGACFYCTQAMSSRCVDSKIFGSAALDGGQAEYVRVPLADSSLVAVPSSAEIKDEKNLVFMADIFPTGYFAASNGFKDMNEVAVRDSTTVVLGCGPVGICALVSAMEYSPKNVIAVDCIPSRLKLAENLGAEAWNYGTDADGLARRVKELTERRGADVVIEVVGHSDALRLGFDLVRPWGKLSSVGVHTAEIPWTGAEAYAKNVQLQFGRCPVRSMYNEALGLLVKKQSLLNGLTADIRPLSQAIQAYDDFNHMKSQKIIFEIDHSR